MSILFGHVNEGEQFLATDVQRRSGAVAESREMDDVTEQVAETHRTGGVALGGQHDRKFVHHADTRAHDFAAQRV